MSVWQRLWRTKHLYLFLVPTFALLLVFSYFPPISAIYNSFFQWDGFRERTFIGLQNFRELFTDRVFMASWKNLFILLGFNLLIGISVPLIVAEMIFNVANDRWRYLYRLFFIIPMVVPGLVGTLLWRFILDPNVGIVNIILEAIGGPEWRQPWLGSPKTVLSSFVVMGFPWVSGVNVLIYLAGLQSIPQEIFDASRMDGAEGISRFFRIDLPLVMGQIKLLLILGVIGGLQAYQAQLILTNGGPGYSSMMPGLVMYQEAFSYNRIGYASAIGLVTFILILGATYINMHYVKSASDITG